MSGFALLYLLYESEIVSGAGEGEAAVSQLVNEIKNKIVRTAVKQWYRRIEILMDNSMIDYVCAQ